MYRTAPLPVMLFRSVLPLRITNKLQKFRRAFRKSGWVGLWTDTVYDYTHFHSNAHEVLGIAKGSVKLLIGGVGRRRLRLKAGDMIIFPAGTGHKRIGSDSGLQVIGAYPPGQAHFDVKRRGRRVPSVPIPSSDPFFGPAGPLTKIWPPQTP
jgi:uncharacterized protein YjlB